MRSLRRTWAVRSIVALAALSVGAAACSSPDTDPVASGNDVIVGLGGSAPTMLRAGQSCDQVLEDFQTFAPVVLHDSFGFVGREMLPNATVMAEDAGAAPTTAAGAADTAAPAPAATGETSDTNTQEAGIDEPDLVETDGAFVYVVDQDQLVILDGATAGVVSRTSLAGYGAQLLLSGDRLLAITGGYGYGIAMPGVATPGMAVDDVAVDSVGGAETGVAPPPTTVAGPATDDGDAVVSSPGVAPDEPTVGTAVEPVPSEPVPPTIEPVPPEPEPVPVPLPGPMPVEPPSFNTGTVIQLIDVSDRTAPRIVQTTEVEGQHVSTRVVDGVARVVVTSFPQPQPLMELSYQGAGVETPEQLDAAIADRVASTTIQDWLPSYRTSTPASGNDPVEGAIVDCGDVLVPEVNAGLAETSILRVDFTDGFDPADTTTVVAEAGTVYASATTLYVAATRYVSAGAQADVAAEDWSTAIHAFDLRGDGAAAHVAAGEVPGNTLNQYSLSEYDGYLRIATTEGTPWSDTADSESAVRVLHVDGDQLTQVGVVGGLGRSETIQSVRFMGPVGYVVTFRQTDPLYVIDLSDPRAPAAVGELKIPGFSSYLHPVADGRLVGIGRDATLEGQDQGLLVSLFDVSDPTAPEQLQTYTERDAYSSAGADPKAFLWWAPESSVIIPVERYAQAPQERPDGYEVGMTVLDVDDSGITQRATVTADGRYPLRAVVVQGRLWSLFDGGAVVSDFANPAQGAFTAYR